MHNNILKTSVFFTTAFFVISFCSAQEQNVFRQADALWRPDFAPRASDVIMRSLRPRLQEDPNSSIRASHDFHVTRHEWTYLNYEMQGGSREASDVFIQDARNIGMLVGGAGSGSSHHVERFSKLKKEDFCVLDIDGNLHVPQHKIGWDNSPGLGSVFSEVYFNIHLSHLTEQLDIGATSLQRDEAQMSLNPGYDFSPEAKAAFTQYLMQNSSSEERLQWGIRNLQDFDVAAYFIQLGIPHDPDPRWFLEWNNDHPVKQHYDDFMMAGIVQFYQRLRARLNDHYGRKVPFSCNNTSMQVWTLVHQQFDWAMSELMFRTANPQHLYERFREGLNLGKVQVLSTPKPIGSVEDPVAFVELNRKVIAQAYSVGGLCKVPWDLFLQTTDGSGRYFGTPDNYADLYGFVRAMAPWMEGYEEAAAYGHEIPDTHGWQTRPVRIAGNDDFYAFVRVQPRNSASPVVIHIVNWGDADKNASIMLRKSALNWDDDNMVITQMSPAKYQKDQHRLAESRQAELLKKGELRGPQHFTAYSHLVDHSQPTYETDQLWVNISDISATPWTVLVVERLSAN